MIPGETVHSMLPQDLPWWAPDHAVFFGVLYIVLFVIGTGLGVVFLQSFIETIKEARKEEAAAK
ncbi:hypothetical protein [Desulfoplanes formicivorans]|uniref:Uncharacterized protein n=1 Tax=Desulfoplanes formicivorans TaxID=1592317 RepID=A0A194AJT0_9BACT|nr:hypothetical protein [Desulfoplanes formicivorans]GAU09573.1 hypothetical protein DPF_2302 [Desulfoplanes formicivorans]